MGSFALRADTKGGLNVPFSSLSNLYERQRCHSLLTADWMSYQPQSVFNQLMKL